MPDYESLLVSKAVQFGGVEKLISKGISSDHFLEKENQQVWKFLSEHLRKYRSAPSFDIVKERFPEYKWQITPETLDYVADEYVVSLKRREGVEKLKTIAKIFDDNKREDIERIEEIFLENAKELAQIIPASNISTFSQMPERIELYKARKAEGKPPGILYGFTKLDEATLGVHPHQYVTIAGFTGIGKSTLGLILSINFYANGFIPMIVSCEMDEEEIYRKLDSIAVGLRQQAIKDYTLSGKDVKRWEEFADRIQDAAANIIVVDVENPTAEKIHAETMKWNPDVVLVDYIQLMSGPKGIQNRWERIDENSKALKRQAKAMKIPVIALSQTNAEGESEGAKLGNIGGAKSIAHHSDVVFGLSQSEEEAAMNKMNISIEKNRMGPKGIVQSLYWDQVNSEFRPWKADVDVYKSIEEEL